MFKIPKSHKDRITYITFCGIFTINIAKEVSRNAAILKIFYEALEVENKDMDLVLNLEDFLLARNKEVDYEKFVPTILKFFYDEELLNEKFLLEWDSGKYEEKMKPDFRYNKDNDVKFRAWSRQILDWLRES